jgi:hypothetical protein
MSASATAACPRMPLPGVARLGFDDGWLLLGPTFLNLQRPVLLVDQALIASTAGLGLESFGSRNPRARLPVCGIGVLRCGSGVSLWTERSSCLAYHWFDAAPPATAHPKVRQVVLLVGNTYEIEASWSALWTCLIGLARTRQLDSDPQPLVHGSPSVNGAAVRAAR